MLKRALWNKKANFFSHFEQNAFALSPFVDFSLPNLQTK